MLIERGDAILIAMATLGFIPVDTALALPAFATGFALIPWYVLAVILLWEQKTGYLLLFEKGTFSFSVDGVKSPSRQ